MKIVIDLGHGGHDSGATNGIKESDIVLLIGNKLSEKLKTTNLDFILTRTTNKYLSLEERCNIANKYGADYFISIHLNSTSDATVRGVEVFQYSSNKLNTFSNQICTDIAKELNIRNRGLKYNKNYTVLAKTKMPACIIETDFISNNTFKTYISLSKNQDKIVDILYKNILSLTGATPTKLYRICVSSFRNYDNAKSELKKVQKEYPSAFIL